MIGWWGTREKKRQGAGSESSADPLSTLSEGTRVFAIGDIHGCDDLLAQIHNGIDEINANDPPDVSIEVVLGDMIDRGPDSRGVIDRLIARSRHKAVVALSGNHETMLLRFLAAPDTLPQWLGLGGLETLRSYGVEPRSPLDAAGAADTAERAMSAIPGEHLAFLQQLPLHCSLGGFTFVHAGLRPGLPLDRQTKRDLTEIRAPFLNYRGSFGTFVVHGHTPRADVEILHNRINLDTGAFATGRLSAALLERQGIKILKTG